MKFLCDVHISFKLVNHLRSLQFETIHVNEILDKWYSRDKDICIYADLNDFIVVTKDSDFRNSFLLKGTPKKLVRIKLGNLSTSILIKVISENLLSIQELDSSGSFMIELDQLSATFIKK